MVNAIKLFFIKKCYVLCFVKGYASAQGSADKEAVTNTLKRSFSTFGDTL